MRVCVADREGGQAGFRRRVRGDRCSGYGLWWAEGLAHHL